MFSKLKQRWQWSAILRIVQLLIDPCQPSGYLTGGAWDPEEEHLTTGEVTTRANKLSHDAEAFCSGQVVSETATLEFEEIGWLTFTHSERCQTQSSNLWAVLHINLSNSYQQTWTLWWYIFKDTTSLLCVKDAVMWTIIYYHSNCKVFHRTCVGRINVRRSNWRNCLRTKCCHPSCKQGGAFKETT